MEIQIPFAGKTHRRSGRCLRFSMVVVAALTLAQGSAEPGRQSQPRPASPRVDRKAVTVLQAMDDAFARAEGLVANYRSESFYPSGKPAGSETTTLRLSRPNLYYLRTETDFGNIPRQQLVVASDGTTRFTLNSFGNVGRCTSWQVAPSNESRETDTFNPIYWSFYNLGQWQIRSALLGHWVTRWRLNDPGLRSVRYVGKNTVDGIPVDVVEWIYTIGYNRPEDDPVYTSLLSIGPDHLVRRIETTSTAKADREIGRIVETITEIRTVPRGAKEDFVYHAPAGVACKPTNPEDVYTTGEYADLPIGSKAPEFKLKTVRGEDFSLYSFLKQHKVVLMNYWGYG